jgi:hypothetical protein
MEEQEVITEVATDSSMEVAFNPQLIDVMMQAAEENFPEVTAVEVIANLHMFLKIAQEKYSIVIGD